MINQLFRDFLDNSASYESSVHFWHELWENVSPVIQEVDEWESPWLKDDGMNDGNPIFSAFSPTVQRAIRVIQHPPESTNVEFEYWLDTFGEFTNPDAYEELVVACSLSDVAASRAHELMTRWVNGDVFLTTPIRPFTEFGTMQFSFDVLERAA